MSFKHGLYRKIPEYGVWQSMRQRCLGLGSCNYHRYGAKGIKVCKRWESFTNFLNDMGRRPSEQHSIERVDNLKGYCRSNCKWATKKEQANNRRQRKVSSTQKYRGVRKRTKNSFEARIKNRTIGFFKDEISAARAYNHEAKNLYGKLALLNDL